MWTRGAGGDCRRPYYDYCFYEGKLFYRKLILLLFFSQQTPLHDSVSNGHLEVCRLLLERKADLEAMDTK